MDKQICTHYYPSSTLRGVDNAVIRPYNFKPVSIHRINYYQQLYRKEIIDDQDYIDLIDIVEDNLIKWKEYFAHIINNDKETIMCYENMGLI